MNKQEKLAALTAPNAWMTLCVAAWYEICDLSMTRTDPFHDAYVARARWNVQAFSADKLPPIPDGDVLEQVRALRKHLNRTGPRHLSVALQQIIRAENALAEARKNAK